MTKKTMSKMVLVSGILFVVLAVIIFVFADGPSRYYSGLLLAIMGTFMLAKALQSRSADK